MIEILDQHPKATTVVKQWFLNIMLESLKNPDIPDEFKELVRAEGIDNERVAAIFEEAPRAFFDVFDENKLYIQIEGDNKNGWSWEVGRAIENSRCSSRKEAERFAVISSFNQLEVIL